MQTRQRTARKTVDEQSTIENKQARPSISSRIMQLKQRRDKLALAEEERALLQEIKERERRLANNVAPSPTLQIASSIAPPKLSEATPTYPKQPLAQRQRLNVKQAACNKVTY
ncbi:hypothetical protein EJ02DRAFT_466801 [Clathrospora elynae]|uniref:Uncharacterized protein n=1 Tax=Clathrospora elynae TaxID=706981 RepID=A0A6A5SR70_9PLEO|nr:hypothetical protein EJ02DRAFT_466801 [Clathrospora elynae]